LSAKKDEKVKDNPSKNFAFTGYLKAFTSAMKKEDGTEPTLADFNQALAGLMRPEIIELLGIKCMVAQVEVGQNGTMHLQGYVQLVGKTRRVTFNNKVRKHTDFTFHVENARGSADENVNYCTKPTGEWEYSSGLKKMNTTVSAKPIWINKGGLVKKGSSTNLAAAIRGIQNGLTMQQIDEQFPSVAVRNARGLEAMMFRKKSAENKDNRMGKLFVLYGGAGTGKSYMARNQLAAELGLTPDDVFSVQFEGRVWFDGYAGEKILLIDDYEPKAIKRSLLVRLTDIYPMTGETKGGHIVPEWDYVIVTSNYHISELFVKSELVSVFDDEGNERQVWEDVPDDAMYSRIDRALDFDGMPDLRNPNGLYQTVRMVDVPKSVSSLLPDTLEHGTNEAEGLVFNGAMRECEGATLTTESTNLTLEQYGNNGTIQEDESPCQ
jgi:hypothetical protein